MMRLFLKAFLFLGLVSSDAMGARLVSYCSMDESKNIEGKNYRDRMPIASVSKVFTSLFAASKFKLDHKFTTVVYYTPVANSSGYYDVHVQGSGDPYFNRFKMHMIISKLNEAGVTKIRLFSFDENVKYLHDTDTSRGFFVRVNGRRQLIKPLIVKSDLNFPSTELVKAQLQDTKQLLANYNMSYAQSDKTMIKKPVFRPASISHLKSESYKINKNTMALFVKSQDLETILKSTNWNSNNFSSNRLMAASGGLDDFTNFFSKLGLNHNDLKFVNGSGQNHAGINKTTEDDDGRLYNEATCETVLRTVRALNHQVKKQNKTLQDVMSVVGVDKGSTVGGATYSNKLTYDKVVAKTGTIGTNITLAGMLNTPKGPRYFMYNVELAFPGARVKRKAAFAKQEENRARALISRELQNLARKHGATTLNYKSSNPLKDNLENYDEDDAIKADGLLEAVNLEPQD